ncbi:MAG TPA: hypothetical protein VK932_22190, partial [Kofleriaceae bacterium]|nr:hypothetical protein [Kofleriaceae bacterium]
MVDVVECLSERAIQELVGGALSGDVLAQARAHLAACQACRTLALMLEREAGRANGVTATLPAGSAFAPAA